MARKREALSRTTCEVCFDNLTRQLYATDASIYRIEPFAVAFPRSAEEASSVIKAAHGEGLAIIARGAGTGLIGGALGDGLVIDFARYNRQILKIVPEDRRVCVQAGVVLDQLNTALKRYGLCFGPDVATSSRATLGGMISNNSSGARAPIYGTTADHVISLKVVLADGRIITTSDAEAISEFCPPLNRLIEAYGQAIAEGIPKLIKRCVTYGFSNYLKHRDLVQIISGSEGTLAGILEAELKASPLPAKKGLVIIAFDSVMEAMEATVDILDFKPAAVEHVDRALLDQTRGQIAFKAARDFLQLDEKPCEAMLIVEFYEDVEARLAALSKRKIGCRSILCATEKEMNLVWELRKAGLSLLTGCVGPAKPVPGIEDVEVPAMHLPEYVASLQKLFRAAGVEGSFYGHAASGLLHVRPVLDLHTEEGRRKLRFIAGEVSALVKQFKGCIAAEHGLGLGRTEYLKDHLSPDLLELTRRVKNLFDPKNIMNPGKIIDDGTYKIERNCRQEQPIHLNFRPCLAFAKKDGSFLGNLEQCNGDGVCLKSTPAMCPTYQATGNEIMSTRGRSNAIMAVLQGYGEGDPLLSPEIHQALDLCLSCKACETECPSNVEMPLLKAELLHARHEKYGMTLCEWLLSRVDLLSELGLRVAPLANFLLQFRPFRALLEKTLGIAAQRRLPPYAKERLDHWYKSCTKPHAQRGRVILWDDTFVRYHEPHIARAAVSVLEAARYEVAFLEKRKCCGRPAFSAGDLNRAYDLGKYNVALLMAAGDDPIIFLEPSCYSMFVADYRELNIAHAEEVAQRARLFEQFILELMEKDHKALCLRSCDLSLAIHVHCHVKATLAAQHTAKIGEQVASGGCTTLSTGCCGMAGSFGMMRKKYELSLAVARPLIEQLRALKTNTRVIANGFSCRQQIAALTDIKPIHIAELLAEAL